MSVTTTSDGILVAVSNGQGAGGSGSDCAPGRMARIDDAGAVAWTSIASRVAPLGFDARGTLYSWSRDALLASTDRGVTWRRDRSAPGVTPQAAASFGDRRLLGSPGGLRLVENGEKTVILSTDAIAAVASNGTVASAIGRSQTGAWSTFLVGAEGEHSQATLPGDVGGTASVGLGMGDAALLVGIADGRSVTLIRYPIVESTSD